MISGRIAEFRLAVMLLTRIPAGKLRGEVPPMSATVWAYPIVGALAALPAALVLWVAAGTLPMDIAAILAIAVSLVVTGALHEDGLADFCDGLGGRTREERLAIMRDSRTGSYGVLALILSIGLRATALAGMPDAGTGALALVCFGAASRAGLPLIMRLQPPARTDGLGFSAGRPSWRPVAIAGGIGLGAIMISGAGILGVLMPAAGVVQLSWYCARTLGGYTGDTLGASQQVADLACWLALLSSVSVL
jgi:adenosylcobinamide-GDP ribazoletransferase